MNKKIICILLSSVLFGCANSGDRDFEQVTMKEAHAKHQRNMYGHNISKARESWTKTINTQNDRRLTFSDELRLPNPELNMTVFPSRNSAGSINSGYTTKFSMYEKVHYKLGR